VFRQQEAPQKRKLTDFLNGMKTTAAWLPPARPAVDRTIPKYHLDGKTHQKPGSVASSPDSRETCPAGRRPARGMPFSISGDWTERVATASCHLPSRRGRRRPSAHRGSLSLLHNPKQYLHDLIPATGVSERERLRTGLRAVRARLQ